MNKTDKFRGCLIGGAAGDALGYTVEFFDDYQIFDVFGDRGITEYFFDDSPCALISDDTQMTLFTANGLLVGKTKELITGDDVSYEEHIGHAYKDWLCTQVSVDSVISVPLTSWLNNDLRLHSRRAPGSTCISACMSPKFGTIDAPINDSKGCGGVMRVAPVGLFFDCNRYQIEKTDMLGAKASALTHGHELGFIPAAAFAHIISLVVHNPDMSLIDAVIDAKEAMVRLFPESRHLNEFTQLIDMAIVLSGEDIGDLDAIGELGEGWVAEEALAIGIYCALKYSYDFESCLIAAVNHCGDSDSTGSIAGNILGAYIGLSGISQKFTDNLELKDVILEIADDLYKGSIMSSGDEIDDIWKNKYVKHTYV